MKKLSTGLVALALIISVATPTYAAGLKAYAGASHNFISPTIDREGVAFSDGSTKTNVFLDIDYTNLLGSESLRDVLTDAILTYSSNNSLGLSASDIVWMNGTINSTTTDANSIFHGLMSVSDKIKLDGILAMSPATNSRSITSSTGAAGFLISSTRNAFVNYSTTISTTATIGGNSSGTVVLEIAPTNSATPSDWVEIGRFTNGQSISLALVLQSVQTLAGQISGMIPAGYYAKLRSINNSGTPSYSYNSGQEIQL